MQERERVLTVLAEHVGREAGIGAQALAITVGISLREVRHIVTALREEGIGVCGTPHTGYYMAQTADDIEETCQFLRGRALHSLHLEAQLRRIPLPDLLGQIRFTQ